MDEHTPSRRLHECEVAWSAHRAPQAPAGRMLTAWEARQLRLLSEEARLHAETRWNSPLLRERLSGEQNHRCCHCGTRMEVDASDPGARPTFEHILPRKRGGNDRPCNLAVACRRCNTERGDRLGWTPRGRAG